MTQRSPNLKMELFKERSREIFAEDFELLTVDAVELGDLIHNPSCFSRRRGNLLTFEPEYTTSKMNLSENLGKLCSHCFNTLTGNLPNVTGIFAVNTFIERCDTIQSAISRMGQPKALTEGDEFNLIISEDWSRCPRMFRGAMKDLLDHYPKVMDDFKATQKAYTKKLLANDQEALKRVLGELVKFPRGIESLRGKSVVAIDVRSASTHEDMLTSFMKNAGYGVTEVGHLRAFITSDYLALTVGMGETFELDGDLDPQTLRTALVLCDGRLSDFKDRLHSAQSL